MKVLIAGAGRGGLTAALALLQRGIDVEVYEQASQLGEIGAGVQLGPNGTRVLSALGLWHAVMEVAFKPAGKELRLWNTGQAWTIFDLGEVSVREYGSPYLMLHRADLHSVLAEAVRARKPDAIRLGARCTGCEERPGGIALLLDDGRSVEGSVVVGADGIRSVLRTQLFGAGKAKFTGGIAWRGLVPVDSLPERLRRPVGANWIGPRGHVVTYPVRRGEMMNFVGHVERSDWQVESWTERGTTEECLADYQGWHPDITELIRRIDGPYRWALFLHEPLKTWSKGRATLLGDACHATLPYLAQGANMALEDGLVLARCLDALRDRPETALVRYQELRVERTLQVVRRSAETLNRFHNDNLSDPQGAQSYVEREWEPEKVLQRYDWLFRYEADAIAV